MLSYHLFTTTAIAGPTTTLQAECSLHSGPFLTNVARLDMRATMWASVAVQDEAPLQCGLTDICLGLLKTI